MDLVDITEQYQFCKVVGQGLVGCRQSAFLRGFREDDALLVAFSARNDFVN